MTALGSNDYPNPFMAVDKEFNGPKGRAFKRGVATGIGAIQRQAAVAVVEDTPEDADKTTQMIRAVSRHSL
jgi:hypothetical protein